MDSFGNALRFIPIDWIRPSGCHGAETTASRTHISKNHEGGMRTKSGIMLGLGEAREEVIQTLHDLRNSNVDVVTIGQYLQPTKKHLPVHRFVHPDEFAEYREIGYQIGFDYVESGPLVRSSYHSERHVIPGYGRAKWEEERLGN